MRNFHKIIPSFPSFHPLFSSSQSFFSLLASLLSFRTMSMASSSSASSSLSSSSPPFSPSPSPPPLRLNPPPLPPSQFFSHPTSPSLRLSYRLFSPHLFPSQTPIVLVMGWTGTKEDWLSVSYSLSKYHPVVVFDHRGVGESNNSLIPTSSSPPSPPYHLSDIVDDIYHLSSHLFPSTPVHLCGCSMGGMIIQHVAVRYPSMISSLVICCSTHSYDNIAEMVDPSKFYGPPPTHPSSSSSSSSAANKPTMSPAEASAMKEKITRLMVAFNYTKDFINKNPEYIDDIVKFTMRYKRPLTSVYDQLQYIMEQHNRGGVGKIVFNNIYKGRVMILHGEKDKMIPVKEGKSLYELIKSNNNNSECRYAELKGVGHAFWGQAPEESVKEILQFLGTTKVVSKL